MAASIEYEWSKSWPDWKDGGKKVALKMPDGSIIKGELFVDDFFFNGEDEVPIFMVKTAGGESVSFADADGWCVLGRAWHQA